MSVDRERLDFTVVTSAKWPIFLEVSQCDLHTVGAGLVGALGWPVSSESTVLTGVQVAYSGNQVHALTQNCGCQLLDSVFL